MGGWDEGGKQGRGSRTEFGGGSLDTAVLVHKVHHELGRVLVAQEVLGDARLVEQHLPLGRDVVKVEPALRVPPNVRLVPERE